MQRRRSTKSDTHEWGARRMSATTADVFGFIRARYSAVPSGAKILSQIADCSHRTTEKWLAGETDPSARALLDICRHDPDALDALIASLRKE